MIKGPVADGCGLLKTETKCHPALFGEALVLGAVYRNRLKKRPKNTPF